MSSKKQTTAGMRMRRPGKRTPTAAQIAALEAQAEQVASKVPGDASEPTNINVAEPQKQPDPPPARHSSKVAKKKKRPAKRGKKQQLTVYLPPDLHDELRRAAVALSGPPHHESITSIVERAVIKELAVLREENGEFPSTSAGPKPGRRASVR